MLCRQRKAQGQAALLGTECASAVWEFSKQKKHNVDSKGNYDQVYKNFQNPILGDAKTAEKFSLVSTFGEGCPASIRHRGGVFPVDTRWSDILKGVVLSFPLVGMGEAMMEQTSTSTGTGWPIWLRTWVKVDLNFSVPLAAQFCMGLMGIRQRGLCKWA